MGSYININGKTYVGNTINIVNNKVYIDGVLQQEGLSGVVEVKVEGNLASLVSDNNVTVTGSVHGDVEAGNNAQVQGDVGGRVDAGNNVMCKDISGSASAGNNIMCTGRGF